MPSLQRGLLLQLHDDYTQYMCFVETGTLCGGTIFAMEPLFDILYTIELSERYYNGTKNSYKGDRPLNIENGHPCGVPFSRFYGPPTSETLKTGTLVPVFNVQWSKITFLLGDSGKVLGELAPTLTQPTIFFLDGHWSSGDTGRGEKDCPLVEEITHIATAFKHKGIIIVDDFRLFGLGPPPLGAKGPTGVGENWMEIRKDTLLDILGTRIAEVYHLDSDYAKDDRLIIHIHAI